MNFLSVLNRLTQRNVLVGVGVVALAGAVLAGILLFGGGGSDPEPEAAPEPTAATEEPATTSTTTTTTTTAAPTVTVPDLTGLSRSDAEQRLRDAGLEWTVSTRETTTQADDGLVHSQDVDAGTEVDQGSSVNVVFYEYTPPTTTATTTTTTTEAPAAPTTTRRSTTTTKAPATTRPPATTKAPATTRPPATTVPKVTVPNVVGMDRGAAEAALTAAGLTSTATPTATTDGAENDIVHSQSVAAGTKVNRGTSVNIGYYHFTPPATTVRMVTVPNLSGLKRFPAQTAIRNAGLEPLAEAVNTDDSAKEDDVIDQNPAAGTRVRAGTTVQFRYYNYTPPATTVRMVTVPNVIGLQRFAAETTLSGADLRFAAFSVVTEDPAETHLEVFSQNPAAGTMVAVDTVVQFEFYFHNTN